MKLPEMFIDDVISWISIDSVASIGETNCIADKKLHCSASPLLPIYYFQSRQSQLASIKSCLETSTNVSGLPKQPIDSVSAGQAFTCNMRLG